MSPERAAEAIADLTDVDLHRHSHLDLLTRAWKLREDMTAYDAMYVALAEALEAPLGAGVIDRSPTDGRGEGMSFIR